MSTWTLVYDDCLPEQEGLREALCTFGNGYFATRGAAEEAAANGIHYPGTYLAGGYNRLKTDITGRVIENEDLVNQREPIAVDLGAMFQAAKEHNVALELNAHPERLDLRDVYVRRAREVGLKIALNSDAHSTANLQYMRYGVDQARRGWLEKKHVLNTMPWRQFDKWLRRRS